MSNFKELHVTGLGNTGGPGNAGETGTGATGGEGMMPETATYSGTGGTGASGLGGDVGKAVSSILDMTESVESFSKQVALVGLYGATGGQGQPGTVDDAATHMASLSDMSRKFSDQINNLNNPEAILEDFNECQATLDLVLSKTNAVNAYFAFMQGKRLNRIQGIRSQQGCRDWIKWITAKLPHLMKRTREKYMSLAAIPGVENYFEYGVERLAEFGSIFISKSDEDKLALGSSPLKKHFEYFHVDSGSSFEERRESLDAIIAVLKLNALGVELPLGVMLSFLRVEDKLTHRENKQLKLLNDRDENKPSAVVNLLESIIKQEFNRQDILANAATPAIPNTQENAGKDQSADESPTGPNIDKLVITLSKSLGFVAKQGGKIEGTFNREALVELKGYIEKLLEMPEASSEATA